MDETEPTGLSEEEQKVWDLLKKDHRNQWDDILELVQRYMDSLQFQEFMSRQKAKRKGNDEL